MKTSPVCRLLIPFVVALIMPMTGTSQIRYSQNVVGYIDAHFYAGSNLFNNPLNAGDNSIASVMKGVPTGTYYQPWAGNGFGSPNRYTTGEGWEDDGRQITRASGGFLWLPEAKTISFVGEPWPAFTLPLPPGFSVVPVIPDDSCLSCASGMQITRWNRQLQRYDDPAEMIPFEGIWVPEKPVLLPDESALLFRPSSTAFNLSVPGYASPPTVTLSNPKRTETEFTFEFTAPNGSTYSVQQANDLTAGNWRTIQTATSVGPGPTKITVPFDSSANAYFRIESLILRHPVRTGTEFQFQFYAEEGVRYEVSRSASLENQSWQTVTTVDGTGAVVTVKDSNANGSVAYYRSAY